MVVCWCAQLAGRFWGPLVLQPFLLHVFTSTDLPPPSYLGTIARRRLAYAGGAVLVAAGTAAHLTTDLFDRPDDAAQGLAVVVGLGALTAPAWLWGQVRPVRDNLGAAAGADGVGLLLALLGGAGGLWLVAGVLAAGAAVLGRAAFGSVPSVDLARLARESARAAQAQTYAVTGTLHHALDLYRPESRGRTSALLRADGQLRGRLAQGAVRALRTPGRAAAGAALLVGGAALTARAAGPGDGPALTAWMAGAACGYLGSGWVSETWRGLRDELTLPPLYGECWGGALGRALAWPGAALAAGTLVGGVLALVLPWPRHGASQLETLPLVAGSVVLVLGARFLREMKQQLPLQLLLPVITPLGDLSGLLVLAWQFDGIVAVVIGVAVMNAVPLALGAAGLAVGMGLCCVWMGLRRTGWARRALLSRLRRA
ncbi:MULTISPECIES: hypothetical protein [Streptomyces]|uniref:hypothetical protein n=1 Tax=Streptomyces TaxID=1883 RepID=UPI001CD02760|nr:MULTISPECIES: hypothetical protein [Streptomyces]MBZ6142252.1 hypothetical protein [Streptomyces olivaceus]MBZ6170023.1 hypothetical protein [Streptomyces olivaceus]MBZ6176430.1 hypothetical protein [Streptomyces olivaceus]MBZ6183486.1 hypothetical protein [Streptomyces olivaceus]MCM8551281.1 hypothetical protein [Streptomyces sp. STCH 565 A]